jgi:S1-C subfamily serine protease
MRKHHNTFGISFSEFVATRNKAEQLELLHRVKSCASGALVGRNLVLTANHAIEADECPKILYKETVLEAKVLVRFPKIDVMLLEFDDSKIVGDVPRLEFGFSEARLGQKLYSLGFPLPSQINYNPLFYSFEVTSLIVHTKPHFFQFQSEISDGNSGSPVVNDRLEIVGIVTSKARSPILGKEVPNNWGFATKSQYFANSITRYLPASSARRHCRLSSEKIAKQLEDTAVLVLACGATRNAKIKNC